jgi:RHS repeat-associated protein
MRRIIGQSIVVALFSFAIAQLSHAQLPSSWLDQDIGTVGLAGSASYANGTFTVSGAGYGTVYTSTDGIHFLYLPLSGDGVIVARLVSLSGTSSQAGAMVRETLDPGASEVFLEGSTYGSSEYFNVVSRTSTGGYSSYQGGLVTPLPYWIKLVRSGNTFIGYSSLDGTNWVQRGSSQTVSMGQNVYVGLAVSSNSTSALATATFDNVSVSSAASTAPAITNVSATTGAIGSQVLISGSGFGATQNGSAVLLNGAPATINSWSDTAILTTIPSGATSGPLAVSVAPSMNSSNPVQFTVTSQPLTPGWLDQDIGTVGLAGSASYANGTFTVSGAGYGTISTNTDWMHFVYQPLSGDGTIVARVVSLSGTSPQAGLMIRETLDPGAQQVYTLCIPYSSPSFRLGMVDRTPQGAYSSTFQWGPLEQLPYWIKLVRSGNTFNGYTSADGVNWVQMVSTQTVSMGQNVYVGLAVSSNSISALATATFDNVSVTGGLMPFITNVSPNAGPVGTAVTINGSSFGSTQGTSVLSFNGVAATSITSWSNTQIVANIADTIRTGPVVVTVNSVPSNSNVVFTAYHPVIQSLSPPNAATYATVTLNGYGFGTNPFYTDQVQFNGVAASQVSPNAWSDTSITVYVPPSATSGPVTVTMNGITSSSVPFTVEATPPTIASVSPAYGVNGAWPITISGTGFGATQSGSTLTFFGSTAPATIISWSDTAITAVVPDDASTGPVTVSVGGLSTDGPWFTVNSVAQVTDSLGNQSSYTLAIVGAHWVASDSQGPGCDTCTIRGDVHNVSDITGNLLSTTDALGHTTTYTYDANNNVASISRPLDGSTTATTSYTYNSFGEVLTMTDALGNTTANTYDAHGNLLSVTSPAPNGSTPASVTQFAYDTKGELMQITDPLSRVTTLTYTPAGLIATITDAQGNVTTYGYDARGDRTTVTDALNHTTAFAYDIMGRLTGITYPDNSTVSFTYDSRGRRTSVTDQNGKTTTYTYDDADRLTAVTDPAHNTTQYAYDTENNLLSITDANGHVTSFQYNPRGWVTQTAFPSSFAETYAYDAIGNLTSKTDRKGQTIQYVYDALNRMTQKDYPDSTSVEYVYDLVGKIKQVTDPTGSYGFAYDNMGRLIGTTTQYSFLPNQTFTNSYTYDAASNRTGFTAPDGSANTYSYDSLNRLSGLSNSWAGGFGFSYDALSRRTQLTRPNGVNTNYTYDSLSRLLSVLHQAGNTTLDGASYTYDAAGNRISKTNYLNNVTEGYTYDPLYQLTQVTQGNSTTESYTYDVVGNRLSSLGMSPYSYNASNELTSTPSGSYTYDANGNTLSDPSGKSYSWDFENRLTQAVAPGTGTTTFKYDPFGRRIQKSGPLGTANYLYDGVNLLEEVDNSGSVLARYNQTRGLDEELSEFRSGATSYYEADGLGTITSLSNPAGALANTYSYDSYGRLSASTGTLTNPFQYTGREFDAETGLYFNRARYFDPATGRWLSEDPIRFFGDKNFYRYSLNNPVNYSDPSGLQAPAPAPAPIPGAGPIILIGIDVWLAQHDWHEFQKLCAASGWSWCTPSPGPSPDPGPSPNPKPGKDCNNNDDDCDKEWAEAREMCRELLSQPNPPRRLTGGYTNIEDCARGLVSERCGGNRIDWGPKGKGK